MNEERYKEEVKRVLDEMDRNIRSIFILQFIGVAAIVAALIAIAALIG